MTKPSEGATALLKNRAFAPAIAGALAALALAAPIASGARTLRVGPGEAFARPSLAATAATAGDRILVAPGTYADCAVLRPERLTLEGDPGGRTVMTGRLCEGKAILVTTGADITLRALTLTGATSPDGNGAGLRDESRTLLVDQVRFTDNQDGILTGAPPDATLVVRDSIFRRNGACVHACAHGIYAGAIALLRIERGTFEDTRIGHHVKSRAARTEIIDSRIADGPRGTSSYLVDIPNGGNLVITGSTLEKGPRSSNHRAAIMIGEEGVTHPTSVILRHDNFRDDVR